MQRNIHIAGRGLELRGNFGATQPPKIPLTQKVRATSRCRAPSRNIRTRSFELKQFEVGPYGSANGSFRTLRCPILPRAPLVLPCRVSPTGRVALSWQSSSNSIHVLVPKTLQPSPHDLPHKLVTTPNRSKSPKPYRNSRIISRSSLRQMIEWTSIVTSRTLLSSSHWPYLDSRICDELPG